MLAELLRACLAYVAWLSRWFAIPLEFGLRTRKYWSDETTQRRNVRLLALSAMGTSIAVSYLVEQLIEFFEYEPTLNLVFLNSFDLGLLNPAPTVFGTDVPFGTELETIFLYTAALFAVYPFFLVLKAIHRKSQTVNFDNVEAVFCTSIVVLALGNTLGTLAYFLMCTGFHLELIAPNSLRTILQDSIYTISDTLLTFHQFTSIALLPHLLVLIFSLLSWIGLVRSGPIVFGIQKRFFFFTTLLSSMIASISAMLFILTIVHVVEIAGRHAGAVYTTTVETPAKKLTREIRGVTLRDLSRPVAGQCSAMRTWFLSTTGETELDYGKIFNLQATATHEIEASVFYKGMETILSRVERWGCIPFGHEIYLQLDLNSSDIKLPKYIRDKYSDEIVFVIQNQYSDLSVKDNFVSVLLFFDGKRVRVEFPISSINYFVDSSREIYLRPIKDGS